MEKIYVLILHPPQTKSSYFVCKQVMSVKTQLEKPEVPAHFSHLRPKDVEHKLIFVLPREYVPTT